MTEWQEYHLEDLYTFASGLSKPAEEFGFGYPFLTFKDVFNNYFIPDILTSLANTTKNERNTCSIKRGDAFLTRTSETAEELEMSSVALKDYPEATFNGFTKRLRPKNETTVWPEFIGYYLRWNRFRAHIISMSSETTRASLNNDMMATLPIILPPFSAQKAIAAVLSSLDDKIDLLHRQNATLEALAEALFRKLFVVEVKEEWAIGTLGDFASCVRDGVNPKEKQSNTVYIGLEHIDKKNITLSRYGDAQQITSTKFAFKKNDILFGKLRPYFHKICFTSFDGVCSTDILVIRAKEEYLFSFCLFAFFQNDVVEYANLGSKGTKMPRTDWETLSLYPFPIPDAQLLIQFDNFCKPLIEKINANQIQIRTLEKLRDTLLPKLMSGEVRVAY